MKTLNARIVAEARSFLNTPFHQQGRIKGVGVDCIGLILGIAQSLLINSRQGGLLSKYDFLNYNIYDTQAYLPGSLDKHLEESYKLGLGKIALFSNAKDLYHVGILADYNKENFSIIHACIKTGKVVEHRLSSTLQAKVIKTYQFHQN